MVSNAKLSHQLEDMVGMLKSKNSRHHKMSDSKLRQQEQCVVKLKRVLEKANPFRELESEGLKMYNGITKVIMPMEIQSSLLSIETPDEQSLKAFVKDRICGEENM